VRNDSVAGKLFICDGLIVSPVAFLGDLLYRDLDEQSRAQGTRAFLVVKQPCIA